jgi:hypothetical protein
MPHTLAHKPHDENHAAFGQARSPEARLTEAPAKPCQDAGQFFV